MDWNWTASDWVLLLLIALVALYYYGTSTFGQFARMGVPHDKPVPFFGNMLECMRNKQYFPGFILDVYNKFKDHQYNGIYMFKQPILLLRDPELVRSITIKDFEYFTDHVQMFNNDNDTVWTKVLVSLKGKRWRDMRATLSPAFTSSKMKTMFVLVSECCSQVANYLEECLQDPSKLHSNIQKDGDILILEMKDFYTRYTSDVIATTAFGIGVDSLKHPKNDFFVMGQDATSFAGIRVLKWLGFAISPALMKLIGVTVIPQSVTNFFKTLIHDTIATREKEGIVRPDMLQLLMQAKKGLLEDENATDTGKNNKLDLDDDDILAQALLFFLAGFDTSSTLLCFASHQIAVHPDVQSQLQEEIDRTLEENGGKFTYDALHNMKYLDMVVSETLRLYPPAAVIERLCVKHYTLHADPPLELLPGDCIFVPVLPIHRDPKYYSDPEVFDPERFSEENKHKINPLTYLPFGMGPRNCIGSRFALMETKLALAHLLSKFTLKVIPKTPMPIKIIQKGFSMTVEGGFWLGLESRST